MASGLELYIIGAVVVVAIGQAATIWIACRQRRALQEIDDRIRGLTAAMSLMADATEGALRDVIGQMERTAGQPAPSARRAAAVRRVTGAARRGLAVRDIAAAERLSEGEVRLRLKLATEAYGATPN